MERNQPNKKSAPRGVLHFSKPEYGQEKLVALQAAKHCLHAFICLARITYKHEDMFICFLSRCCKDKSLPSFSYLTGFSIYVTRVKQFVSPFPPQACEAFWTIPVTIKYGVYKQKSRPGGQKQKGARGVNDSASIREFRVAFILLSASNGTRALKLYANRRERRQEPWLAQ